MFKDKEVDTKVKYKLGIFDGTEPLEEDLNKITDIFISNVNAKGEKIGTDISEISRLKKLKSLDLKGFEIDEKIVEIINSFPELLGLKLYGCSSKDSININAQALKTLILDNCKSINLNETKLPECLIMINCGIVDISKFLNSSQLKDLQIKSSEIMHTDSLREMKALKILNVDGSTLDNEEILKELKNRKVLVSYEYEYHPIK